MFIPKDQIEWKKVGYLRQGETRDYDYSLILNEPLASWDVWDYWERARVESMREHLHIGDVLFDVGTEQGWCDLAYAQMVGPENMVLVEPTPEFWPNIQALWEKNYPTKKPLNCFNGFFSDKTTNKEVLSEREFPAAADGDLIDKNSYRYIHQDKNIPQITIDDFITKTNIHPTALTIDVEGAELLVLRGAEKTLSGYNVKVWVSEHDDLAEQNYHVTPDGVKDFMEFLGYKREVLSTDHERHVYYSRV